MSKIGLGGYQPGLDTDLLPVELSVASGVFINVNRGPPKAADATSVVYCRT